MGLKGLLWAAVLISVARIFTVFLPTQGASDFGIMLRTESGSTQPYRSLPSAIFPVSPDANGHNPVQAEPDMAQAPFSAESSVTTGCKSAGEAVVTVYAGREVGSGSIISPSGLVLTNDHVVSRLRQRSLYVETLEGDRYDGRVLATDRRNDLALVQLETQALLPIVRLTSKRSAEVGQAVCAIGSPLGQAGVLTEGQLLKIRSNGDLESNVLLKPGSSGGPLLNAQGEMIGVNKGVAKQPESNGGDRNSFATSINVVKEFLQQNRLSYLFGEPKN
ncbi:S1C family serine protease [Leptolyngbyaceae cyanobacterium UHCC 1019]